MTPRDTQHRRQILDILAEGPIVDTGGLAIQKLQRLTGHETTNALSKVLRAMQQHGQIVREVRGRRTFRIALASTTPVQLVRPSAAPLERENARLREEVAKLHQRIRQLEALVADIMLKSA